MFLQRSLCKSKDTLCKGNYRFLTIHEAKINVMNSLFTVIDRESYINTKKERRIFFIYCWKTKIRGCGVGLRKGMKVKDVMGTECQWVYTPQL